MAFVDKMLHPTSQNGACHLLLSPVTGTVVIGPAHLLHASIVQKPARWCSREGECYPPGRVITEAYLSEKEIIMLVMHIPVRREHSTAIDAREDLSEWPEPVAK